MPTAFVAEWKKIKKDYETETGKKKPSEKFMVALGAIHKKSGVTDAFKAFESALKVIEKTLDPAEAKKAFKKLESEADAYQATLWTASVNEKTSDIRQAAKDMGSKLYQLVQVADGEWRTEVTFKHLTVQELARLMKTAAGARITRVAKASMQTENLEFLLAMSAKDYSEKSYKKWVAPNAPDEVNLPTSITKLFKQDDLKDGAPWEKATKEILRVFNNNVVARLNEEIGKK